MLQAGVMGKVVDAIGYKILALMGLHLTVLIC
jgi:hypothetical protein